jgi:CheY-like chemotaxis protein
MSASEIDFQASELSIEVLGMNPVLRHVLAGLLTVGMMCQGPSIVWSQDAEKEAPAEPADPAAGAEPDATIPAAQPDGAKAVEPGAVQSPLAVEPKSPEELFDAILLMVDIAKIPVAKQYLKKFLADEPSDELLLKLREKYGPAAFLRLSNIKELRPEAKILLDRNNVAYLKFANDPERMGEFLKNLISGTTEQKITAQHEIETAGILVVPALIRALGELQFADSQTPLVEMLVRIGKPALGPMHAALLSPNLRTRQSIILALGLIRSTESIPYLLRFAGQTRPTEESEMAKKAISRILRNDSQVRVQLQNVANRLLQQARDYFAGRHVWQVGNDGLVSTWSWEQSVNTVRERRQSPDAASREMGLFFAKSALDVAPDRKDIQTTYLNLLFAEEVAIGGLSKPLKSGPGSTQDLATSLGADAVIRALSEAMDMRKPESALVALRILSKIGTVQQVRTVGGKQPALQRALNYPNRRVQFAAAQTIVGLDPANKYPGRDRVVAILGRALTQAETTEKMALVLDSNTDRGQSIAGLLNELGYQPTHRRTGREGFGIASTKQELDLILIDANIQRWGLSETLANLKNDPRTMDVPVLIYGETITERNVRVYVQQFRGVSFIELPATSDDLRRQMGGAVGKGTEAPLTPEERSTKSLRAAEVLAFLGAGHRRYLYDFTPIEGVLLATVENTQLAGYLVPVIATLPSVAAQRRLEDVAVDDGQPNDVRVIATQQLAAHIRQFGLLLPKDQIDRIRASWEQTTDPRLYSEMAAVIGILKPNSALVGQRLRKAPSLAAPGPASEVAPEPAPDMEK